MKLTDNMRRKIADKIKSELKRMSGYDFTVLVLHYTAVTITIGPYDSEFIHDKNMHQWMEMHPLTLSDIVQKACDFRWVRTVDTWVIDTGVIEYSDFYEDNRIDHDLKAYYVYNSECGEFEFIGDYDNENPADVDWKHGDDDGYEFEKDVPDYVKKDLERKPAFKAV